MSYCCVVNCNSDRSKKEPGVKFYNFPWKHDYDVELRQKWVRAIKRRNHDGSPWQPSKSTVVCSKHFPNGQKSTIWNHPNSVPSIFPEVCRGPTGGRKEKRKKECFDRVMKRRQNKEQSLERIDFVDEIVEQFEDPSRQGNDVAIQAFYPGENSQQTFTFITDRVSGTDVGIQCSLPQEWDAAPSKRKKTEDVGCGTSIIDRRGFCGYNSVENDEQMISLCGINFDIFSVMLRMIEVQLSVSLENPNVLMLLLMKLKTNLSYTALGLLFQVDCSTVSKLFEHTLAYLCKRTENFIQWPSKHAVRSTLPTPFQEVYPNARVIMDCTEVKCEQPRLESHRVLMYSDDKGCYTMKILLGINPNGYICFKSKSYGGRTSDTFIVNDSGFLSLLEPDDAVLADKGFPGIKIAGDIDIKVIPPSVRDVRLTSDGVETEKIASLRTHVERAIRRVKYFGIMHMFAEPMFPYIDQIVHICCVLANFMGPLIKDC